MKPIAHPLSLSLKLSFITLSLLLTIATAVGARALLSPATTINPSVPSAAGTAQEQRQAQKAPIAVEVITLRPTGFEPAELNLTAGQFLFVVHNRSSLERIDLLLTHQAGERVHEARVQRERPTLRKLVKLRPGRYTLTEAEHPEWVCNITVADN